MTAPGVSAPEFIEGLRAIAELADRVAVLSEFIQRLAVAVDVPLTTLPGREDRGVQYARERVAAADAGRAAPEQIDQILAEIAESKAAARRAGGVPIDVNDPDGSRRAARIAELRRNGRRVSGRPR